MSDYNGYPPGVYQENMHWYQYKITPGPGKYDPKPIGNRVPKPKSDGNHRCKKKEEMKKIKPAEIEYTNKGKIAKDKTSASKVVVDLDYRRLKKFISM